MAKKPKASKKTGTPITEKKPSAKAKGKVVGTSHDPKNREVTLIKHGNFFKVYKAATGFNTPWIADEAEAQRVFESQVADSQNTAQEYTAPAEETTSKDPVMEVSGGALVEEDSEVEE